MSEVKRYGICGFEGGIIELKEGHLVHVDDFDRVTAERDALQQRLTAADEELDQCQSMALMIEEKEWAEHVGKGPISSRVESAFTQLHNELSEARQAMTTNRTIDGVPREQMISFPRELSDELAELIAEKARVCGGGAFDIWEAICEQFGTPSAQPTPPHHQALSRAARTTTTMGLMGGVSKPT